MKRALAKVMLVAGVALASAPRASAQAPIRFYFGKTPADTAVGVLAGTPTTIPVRLSNPQFYTYYDYVMSARLVVHFDPAKIAILAAVPSTGGGLTSIDTFTVVGGTATIAASASGWVYGSDAEALGLRVQLQAGVTDGAYLWIQADSAYVYDYYAPPYGPTWIRAQGTPGQTCHASNVWGDVDGNGLVDSRDALITLSAAVGLPVTGFNLAQGDVDGDGLANSRDALMMLSYAIGNAVYQSNRVGVADPDACPGLTPPGETVVFRHTGAGSGGIYRLDSTATTPVQLTTTMADQWPRLNGAGTLMVFQCPDTTGYAQVCRAASDGTGRVRLTFLTVPGLSTQPDWSPDGTHFAFNAGGGYGIARMTVAGDTVVPVYGSGMFGSSLAWSRIGDSLAISNPSGFGLYVFPIGSPLPSPLDLNFSLIAYNPPIRWSPDGLTLATINANGGGIVTLPVAGGVNSLPAAAPKGTWAFDWGPQGVIFSMPDYNGVMSLWLLQGGFGGPLVRLTNPGTSGTDDQPSFRRNP